MDLTHSEGGMLSVETRVLAEEEGHSGPGGQQACVWCSGTS